MSFKVLRDWMKINLFRVIHHKTSTLDFTTVFYMLGLKRAELSSIHPLDELKK
jgi:hypothetical protein